MNQVVIKDAPQMKRVSRRPSHPFYLKTRPFQIQPFMIAPVLPNETLQSLVMQSRAVTDPINNSMIGWHKEYYFFYVKFSDLHDRDTLVDMVLDPDADMSSLDGATNAQHFHHNGTQTSINWVEKCLRRVTETYFRNEGEAWDDFTLDGMPVAQLNGNDYTDSIAKAADIVDGPDYDLASTTAGQGDATAAVKTSEIVKYLELYEFNRNAGLIDMTYEDFLKTYGVELPKAEEHHTPELLRYVRDWTYPTNTVDPTNGTPSAACSWSIAERADKKRYFKEPGFIFGVTVTRPKLYKHKMDGSLTAFMNDAKSWLPAVMANDPWTSIKEFVSGDGPLPILDHDYVVDIKDLFLYGEHFVNFAFDHTGYNDINYSYNPLTTGTNPRYTASDTVAYNLFVDNDNTNGKTFIREDGVVNLNIKGAQMDTSPRGQGNSLVTFS